MGLCHDFGSQIAARCDHPMRAGANACTCDECGVVCSGLFDACVDVWARGPHPVLLTSRPRLAAEVPVPTPTADAPAPTGDAPANGQTSSANGQTSSANGQTSVPDGQNHQPEADSLPPAVSSSAAENRTNGTAAAPRAPSEAARTEVFRWFEREFGALRDEVAALRAALAHEQAPGAGGEPRVEQLASLVDEAVAKAVAGHLAPLEESVTGALKSLRRELREARLSNERSVLALRDALAEAKSLPASHLAPLAEAVADSAARSESLLTGLAETVADSANQSAAELAALRRRLDRVTQTPAPQPSGAVISHGVRISLRDHALGASSRPSSLAEPD